MGPTRTPENRDPEAAEFTVWRRPFHSLPTRISFFVLTATLCSSLIVTGVSVQSIESLLHEKTEQNYPALLENARERLALWSSERAHEVREISTHPEFVASARLLATASKRADRRKARDQLTRLLSGRLPKLRDFDALFVASDDGRRLVWVGESSRLQTEPSLLVETDDAGFATPIELYDGHHVQIVEVATARDERGRELVLGGVLDLSGLAEVFATRSLGSSGWIGLVDDKKSVVIASHGAKPPARYLGPLTPHDIEPEVLYLTTPEGVELLTVSQRLADSPWALALAEPRGEAMAPVVRAIRRALGINLVVISLFGLIAYRVSIRMVQPIEALSIAAQNISHGDRDPKLPDSSAQDEVGILTRAFSEMARRVDDNARALETTQVAIESANRQLVGKNDELRQMNEVLEQLSITDGLTQLHNHRHFQDSLHKECKSADRTGQPLTLILVDVDHFKSWNDRIGHAGGDEILRGLAEVMKTLVRGNDLLARYGGEEFALVAPGTDLDGAVQLAEKMRETISRTRLLIDAPSERERVTVSMGVALYRGDRKRLFSDADEALYRAKAAGRDCVMVAERGDDH